MLLCICSSLCFHASLYLVLQERYKQHGSGFWFLWGFWGCFFFAVGFFPLLAFLLLLLGFVLFINSSNACRNVFRKQYCSHSPEYRSLSLPFESEDHTHNILTFSSLFPGDTQNKQHAQSTELKPQQKTIAYSRMLFLLKIKK